MMAELTPPRDKFGHPSGQSWPTDFSWPIIIQSNFCNWEQENFKALTYHMNYLCWYFGIQFDQ